MEYYFNQLDPVDFQRLINTILIARFGEDARITPLRGSDGGRDGETAPGNPYFEFQVTETTSIPQGVSIPPRIGRYLFQVKHHRTTDKRLSDVRQSVITDFEKELKNNVLKRAGDERVNYFFLITNVPSSNDALKKLDSVRHHLIRNVQNLHADIWWQERVITYLDQMPSIWTSFSQMFAGGIVPTIGKVVDWTSIGIPRAIRIAIDHQYEQDKNVKFRQIELEQNLSKLFVDIDIDIRDLEEDAQQRRMTAEIRLNDNLYPNQDMYDISQLPFEYRYQRNRSRFIKSRSLVSALGVLLDDDRDTLIHKLILEGGPGQGKSTLVQMAVQIYREQLLSKNDLDSEKRWLPPQKTRLPFRVELRRLAEWLSNNPSGSVEEYLALTIKQDSGGNEISVNDIDSMVENSPMLLIFDGLDEIGSDKLRDDVLKIILDCIQRFEEGLHADLRVILTTRPPALTGRRERLIGFERLTLTTMEKDRIKEYVTRWLNVQIRDSEEKNRIRQSFEHRQDEPHVEALVRNPMQLSVLLQFIGLKGEAFPDRRAELYRDYFQIVIDRDVEKSPELRENRAVIEALHAFLGYKIHALTEVNQADRTLERKRLLDMVSLWLSSQGHDSKMAQQFFRLGEERFGLVVASKGEGEETKYGYEVQPIQEYFAAAFLSNQIPADKAHEVFEKMIHRSYWKEVALFLAGLRRPNEKADLVARAKRVDQDRQLGWYQDGRSIVLQLLYEGVLSEPPYVFSEALDFVLDLLDIKKIKVQLEPPALLSTLEGLVSRNHPEHLQKRVYEMMQDYDTCDDQYTVMRIHKIASRLLQLTDYETAIRSYKGSNPELIALVRLGWPYSVGINLEKLTKDHLFWEGVPDYIWARIWWREGLHRGIIINLPAPVNVHQHLIEQFATDYSGSFSYGAQRQALLEVQSKLAVWSIVQYPRAIRFLAEVNKLSEVSDVRIKKDIESICDDNLDIDYSGLDEPIQTVVNDLVQLSRPLVLAFCNEEKDYSPALNKLINGVREHLQDEGLSSWVTCRFATAILLSLLFYIPRKGLRIEKEVFSLANNLAPFYRGLTTSKEESSKYDFLEYLIRSNRPYAIDIDLPSPGRQVFRREIPVPNCVRIKRGTKPVSLIRLLAKSISNGDDLPFTWMKRMQFTTEFIRPLVEICRDCLPDLLMFLGKYSFIHGDSEHPLQVQDTQRVLKIARRTDDPNIMGGVATVLLNANFLRLSDPGLIQKILQTAPKIPISNMLFRINKAQFESGDQEDLDKKIELIRQVADSIVGTPTKYAFQTVCMAVNFLAEHQHVEFPPLLYEEPSLGILPR